MIGRDTCTKKFLLILRSSGIIANISVSSNISCPPTTSFCRLSVFSTVGIVRAETRIMEEYEIKITDSSTVQ